MASNQEDLIDFNIIESHKENIQSLPSGRSAKALAALYSPPLSARPSGQSDPHAAERAVFDAEVEQIQDADDPLDVYDRYVKWTLATYPSAQSTPHSRLLPLLEHATKAFLSDGHYKNDVRYLRLWLHYVGLFSDAPKETFVFMARNGVGQELALFYEEYAAWLEAQGRWSQAEEVYTIGIEKEARPAERLIRKYGEFERRKAALPKDVAERPDSPVLPVVRQVLGQKVDPFVAAAASAQAQQETKAADKGKKKTAKMAIFADDGAEKESVMGSKDGQSWDSIGSLHSRKRENTVEATSWAGQTMKVGKTNAGVEKMQIFRSDSLPSKSSSNVKSTHEAQYSVNPRSGRREVVYVNLSVVYPGTSRSNLEYCFEEVMAKRRGWLSRDWKVEDRAVKETAKEEVQPLVEPKPKKKHGFQIFQDDGATENEPRVEAIPQLPDMENLPVRTISLNDENNENALPRQVQGKQDDIARRMRKEERANRTRKIKAMPIRQEKKETQTIQLNLASPTGPKMKRNKKIAEPTMTINTREAMDEIYGIFSQPAAHTEKPETEDEEEDSDDDDDYTSCGESTTTGKMSAAGSEYGDETRREIMEAYAGAGGVEEEEAPTDAIETETEAEDKTDNTGWSDFTSSKHLPQNSSEGEVSEKAKLQIFQDDTSPSLPSIDVEHDLATPVDHEDDSRQEMARTRYVPLPPEDYEPTSGTYRDRAVMANNRLPFMTPIAEATESSIGTSRTNKEKDYFTAKTPSRLTSSVVVPILEDDSEAEPWSSPFQEKAMEANAKVKPLDLLLVVDGPLIHDLQVNPCDLAVREFILSHPRTRLAQHEGFFDHGALESGRVPELKRFAKACNKKSSSAANENKTSNTLALPPSLNFPGVDISYVARRELGVGAFAPVYLVEAHASTSDPAESSPPLAAVKIETSPPSAWEFHILHLAHSRLSSARASASLVNAHACHVFADASFLIEDFSDCGGTLLDAVNAGRNLDGCTGGPGAGLDESLAMFYTVELLRTVEALHSVGIIHGDLKADNVLLRSSDAPLGETYDASGASGWSSHGVTLIDLGRGIDVRCFAPATKFVADWTTSDADCAEMRECRPWTFHTDYHGLAAVAHTLLFGKYMSVITASDGPMATRRYRPRDGLKRYWNQELWGEFFSVMLNPGTVLEREKGGEMPVLVGMGEIRGKMEAWLGRAEGGGKGEGLRSKVRRVEEAALAARRKK